MKRAFTFSIALAIVVLMAVLTVPQLNRASCFRNGALSYSHAEASVGIVERLFRSSESAWVSLGISEPDLLSAINVLEVNGPAMTFEHHSTRYVKFELANCPAIEQPISLGFHCGDSANLSGIAQRCRSNSE